VTLSVGVPDLVSGRRPVVPPFARMARASGTVEVRFAVNAAGNAAVQAADGPDLLKPAAEQAVASWVFRRTTADRLNLVAVFNYSGEGASAAVRPQEPGNL
jgi:outer membrane biosynthesis protein TonB